MNEHEPRVEQHRRELYSFRGGCAVCAWVGPHRDTVDEAKADASQHLLDVERFPDPYGKPHR